MTTKEQENFYRHSTVIVDETKDSFLQLLDFYLTNQGITLQKFIEINGHYIYHLCFNRYPCCQCPSGTRAETRGNRILHLPQLEILYDKTGHKLPVHNPRSKSAPHCCCPVNPNLKLQNLDFTLARLLLVNCTPLVPHGSPERIALDDLVNSRNHSLAHAKEGKIADNEFQTSMAEIEKALLVFAKVYGKETETKQRLYDIAKQPLNPSMCLQLQTTLLQQCQIDETIKQLLVEKKLPDCLTSDLCDITVTEGCDAHFEIRTKECGLCSLWLRDGLDITRSEKFITGQSGKIHSLDIRNTLLSDKGLYSVRIQDIERHAHLYVAEYFTKNLQSVECIEGETAEFTCEVKEDSLPARWNKNGNHMKNYGNYEILQAGKIHKLSIKKCELHDTAEYTVTINNRVRETSLVVIEYFTKPLATMKCIEGENVQFECEVHDDNQTALWFKEGSEVSTSDRYKTESHGRLHKLAVINTRLDDKGEYSVKIKHCVRHSQLIVQEYFTKAFDTQTYIEGEDVQFECEVLGDNQMAVWFKDGTEVGASNKYKMERHGKLHRLVVFNTMLDDIGKYSVKIKNCVRHSKLIVKGIQDTRLKQKCGVCEKESSGYLCHECQRSMCQDCNDQHFESTDTRYHFVQHIQDMHSLDYNFKVNARGIFDIQVLHDDVLVIALCGNQLVTCDITGQQQHTIPFHGNAPQKIAVVDKNTVAATLHAATVVIVDVRQRQVIQRINLEVGCLSIMYRENQLFVGCDDKTIKVMNISLEVTRTIPVRELPNYICGGKTGRIYYAKCHKHKLYCIDTLGNTLFTFTYPNISYFGITTDDEGHVLAICGRSFSLLRISPDSKQSQVIITNIPSSVDWSPHICYNSRYESVVFGVGDNVYVFKKL